MGLLQIAGADQALDDTQTPVAGAKRYVFAAEEGTLLPVYRDPDLTYLATQPMIADENGYFDLCYLAEGKCRVVIKDRANQSLREWSDVWITSGAQTGYEKGFGTVSEMLTDTRLSYASAKGKHQIASGQKIFVLEGTHVYRILEQTTGQYHLQTAGGVKLQVVSVENGCAASAWGAVYDGVTDNSPVFQAMVDQGVLDIFIDAKGTERVAMGTPILIHGHAGLRVRGLTTKARLIPLNGMSFDSARLAGLGLTLEAEYDGRQCFFMITEYDGENDRFDKAARDYGFSNLAIDAVGFERQISVVSAPHASHIKFKDLRITNAAYLYDGWLLSNSASRHYHNTFQNLRLLDCKAMVSGEYVEGNAHIPRNGDKASTATSYGTSFNIFEASQEACREGLKIYGKNYSQIGPFSVDNNYPGSYALDIYDSQCAFGSVGIENRLGRRNGESGGGVCRIKNSTITFSELTIFAGDEDEIASAGYPISDYDDGSGEVDESLFVIDQSWVTIKQLYGDMDRQKGQTQWPIIVKGDSIVRATLGAANGITSTSHFDVRDTSIVHLTRPDGQEIWLTGPGHVGYVELQNVVSTGTDNTTCIANPTLDVLWDLPENVVCRVNQGAAGGSDPSDYNLPSAAYGGSYYGVIRKETSGQYASISYSQTNARVFSNQKGGSWTGWRQVSGPLIEVTAAQIADVGHGINTAPEKTKGVRVWDSTNRREMRARGSDPVSIWDVVDGSASVTPA